MKAKRETKHLVIGTWRDGADGATYGTRPEIEDHLADAENRAEAMLHRLRTVHRTGEGFEVTLHKVDYDVQWDERDKKERRREIGRVHVSSLNASGWLDADDKRPMKLERVQAWSALIKDDRQRFASGPPVPPEHVKREGPQSVRGWYKARLEAADERHAERVAAMQAIAE